MEHDSDSQHHRWHHQLYAAEITSLFLPDRSRGIIVASRLGHDNAALILTKDSIFATQ